MFKEDKIVLKWGTLKGWKLEKPDSFALLKQYFELGKVSISSMMQKDTSEQKDVLCKLIQQHDGFIYLDWDGKYITKDEALDYILNHGK